jgi:hypothetical protein
VEMNPGTEIEFALHQGPRRRPGSQIDPGRLPRVTQVLALALSFQDMIATGKARNYEDLAKRTGVTRTTEPGNEGGMARARNPRGDPVAVGLRREVPGDRACRPVDRSPVVVAGATETLEHFEKDALSGDGCPTTLNRAVSERKQKRSSTAGRRIRRAEACQSFSITTSRCRVFGTTCSSFATTHDVEAVSACMRASKHPARLPYRLRCCFVFIHDFVTQSLTVRLTTAI